MRFLETAVPRDPHKYTFLIIIWHFNAFSYTLTRAVLNFPSSLLNSPTSEQWVCKFNHCHITHSMNAVLITPHNLLCCRVSSLALSLCLRNASLFSLWIYVNLILCWNVWIFYALNANKLLQQLNVYVERNF